MTEPKFMTPAHRRACASVYNRDSAPSIKIKIA